MWILTSKSVLGGLVETIYNNIDDAKLALMQLRKNGCDGFIWRAE